MRNGQGGQARCDGMACAVQIPLRSQQQADDESSPDESCGAASKARKARKAHPDGPVRCDAEDDSSILRWLMIAGGVQVSLR